MTQTKTKRRTLLLLVLLLTGGVYAGWVYSRGSLSFLACRLAFQYHLMKDGREIEEQTRSGLSSTYYFTSYYLHGILSAAEGTGDVRLLRKALHYIDNMLATVQVFEDNGKTYRAWRPFDISAESELPRPNLHFTFQATVPIARAASVIMNNPRFLARHGETAQRYVAFVDQSIIQYWYLYQLRGENPWINPDHFPIWNDNGSNLALILTFMYRATGDQRYYQLAKPIGDYFKSKLSPYGNGWIWENQTIPLGSDTDNTPGSVGNQAGVPDTSHANREAMLVVSMHESGIVFNREDVNRMTHTFTDMIWNQSLEHPMFSNYINGNDRPYRVYKDPGLNGSIYHGWILVGGYSPLAQKVLLATFKATMRSKDNPSLVRNVTSYGGALSMCGHLLRNFAIVPREEGASPGRRFPPTAELLHNVGSFLKTALQGLRAS